MTRTIFAIATALLAVMTVLASAAEACISCEHVPVVVRGSTTSDAATPFFYVKKHSYTRKRFYRAAKKRKARPAKKRVVKRKTITEKIKTAKTAPIETETETNPENENSTISTTSLDTDEIVKPKAKPKAEPKVNKNVGCKKFFPSVGMTLTVPCE
ncbi:MAG: hypothetical protein ABUJ98_11900 [Hyphomicrobium sp.]